MPYKSLKPCDYPLCPNLVEKGQAYCNKHKEKEPKREYKGAYKRGWQRLRDMYLKENPLCEECKAKGIVEKATEVHHKIPIEERPDLRLSWENLQSLCKSCHSGKTMKENIRKGLM